jgi:hypothetical protein
MRKLIVITAALAAAATVAGPASASRPIHVRAPLDFTVPSPEYSAACGFAVTVTATGTLDVRVHLNPDGSVREQDAFPGLRITVSAPSTGRSFSHVFGPTTYVYPEGVFVGAPALITSNGVRGDAPGIAPDAGRVVWPGVVVDVIPDLGPITVPTGPPLSQHGHFEDAGDITAAVCAALAAV